jgi:hypothetical protein
VNNFIPHSSSLLPHPSSFPSLAFSLFSLWTF